MRQKSKIEPHVSPKLKYHEMTTRDQEKYMVHFANTARLQNSSIIYMQRLLNEFEKTKF